MLLIDRHDDVIPAGYTVQQFMAEAGHAWRTLVCLRALEADDVVWATMKPADLAERIKRLACEEGALMDRCI